MTREEQVTEASEYYYNDIGLRVAFEEGAKWADEHPAQSIANLQAEIITLKAELESACEQLKMNAENIYKLGCRYPSWKEVRNELRFNG